MSPRLVASILACLAVVPAADAARKSREPPTLAELAGRSVAVDPTAVVVVDPGQAARGYEEFLRIEGADEALRAQALRRLGDLRLAESETIAARDGADAPAAARAAREAIDAYRRLLREQPDDANRDSVLYQLARALEQTGDGAAALAALDQLIAAHAGSVHYAEAQFRRGETFFSARRYADAERAYAAVLAAGRSSDFAQQAQYKLAWSLFKQSRDDESTAAFLVLLDGLLQIDGRLRAGMTLSRPEQELADDALRALAITFAAGDGPDSLQAALVRHGPTMYESRLYGALGDLYVEKERYQDGAEAYRAFARRQPASPEAPLLLVRAVDAYAKGGFTSLVLDGKRELVGQYGPRSEFWAAQGDGLDADVKAAIESNLLDLAQHHHALAQKHSGAEDRAAAIRWYQDYLDGFDDRPRAPATRLLLADLLFEGQQYENAATQYERAAYGYADNPEAARAGYAALVAYEKARPQASGPALAGLEARAIESSLRFADTFAQHPEVPGVLTRTTKALFDANDRERAESVAQRVLALGARADAGQQLVAWTVLAHTYFESARYVEAEEAYAELSRRLPIDDPLRSEATERLAASVYRQAEAKAAAGDTTGAVREFLRIAQVAPASPVRATAEFDAATLLLNEQAWTEAAMILEAFRRTHPDHALQPEVTRKLAVAYVEGDRPQQAAVEFERVAATDAEPIEVRRAALWQAAELYDSIADVGAARRAYEAYVTRFPIPFDAAIEARNDLVRLASTSRDEAARVHWLGELVAADAAAGSSRTERSRLLAADASLELAGPLDSNARAVRLAVPLDRSLLAKKSALEAALAAYTRAAGYGVVPVATAATFAMAELYRHLGAALLESQRPPDLSVEELEQYDLLLEEQAFPFEEKAIGIHERNLRLAAEGVYDESVQRSYAALAELNPGRYARVERDAGAPAGPADVAQLEAALVAEPARADLLNRLAIAQRRLGRFAEARATYAQAIAIDPLLADAELNLAVLLDLYLGDPDAALPHYERYLLLAGGSTDEEARSWLAELHTRLGRVQRTAETAP
jgi:tetratricopeptide (TPR) repeat protein